MSLYHVEGRGREELSEIITLFYIISRENVISKPRGGSVSSSREDTFRGLKLHLDLFYLSAVDILDSLLSQEEIDIVIILQHLDKVWS